MREDDGISIEVQELFGLELTESFPVEFDSGPARGEAGHKNIDVNLDSLRPGCVCRPPQSFRRS